MFASIKSLQKKKKKKCVRSRDHIFGWIRMNLDQNVCLHKISKRHSVRSRGHIFDWIRMKLDQNVCLHKISKKHCVRSRGHIFGWICMKLDQNVCLHKISKKNIVYALESRVKTRVLAHFRFCDFPRAFENCASPIFRHHPIFSDRAIFRVTPSFRKCEFLKYYHLLKERVRLH